MHYFDNSTVLLEEIEAWGTLGQLLLRIILQDFVYLEAQGQNNLILFAEL